MSNTTSTTNTTPIESIAQDGNVIFEVGQPISRRLRVSSTVLSTATPYFKALFGPDFREGQTPLEQHEVTISILEDDAQALSDMCNLLHGRPVPELVGTSVSPERILYLAIVIDKYQCVETLALQAQGILFPNLVHRPHSVFSLAQLTVASYLLKVPNCFTEATGRFIGTGYQPLHKVIIETIASRLPANVLLAIATRQVIAFRTLAEEIPSMLDGSDVNSHDCGKLIDVGSWPPRGLELRRFVDAGVEVSEIQDLAEEIKEVCAGLCLYCAKAGVWDLSKPCAVSAHCEA